MFFLALRNKKCVGRIVAHINNLHNEYQKTNDGFFGFYECLNSHEASKALLNAAENWLRKKGMAKIIGPENYTIYDEIGFMVDGWEADPSTPVVMQAYNRKYFIDQMEKSGYKKEMDWYAFIIKEPPVLKDTFFKIKERLTKKQGFVFRTINMKKYNEDVEKIKSVFHAAWTENWGHFPYTDRQFEQIAKGLKLFIDPRLVFLVEKDGKAVACSVTIPDINLSVKRMNGRLFPFGIWHLLRAKKNAYGLRTFLFGVLEEYRNKGLDLVMVVDTILNGKKAGYKWSECSLVVENNKKIIGPIEKWGGELYKTYRLFSKKI